MGPYNEWQGGQILRKGYEKLGDGQTTKLRGEAVRLIFQLNSVTLAFRSWRVQTALVISKRCQERSGCFPGPQWVPRTQGSLENKYVPSWNRKPTIYWCKWCYKRALQVELQLLSFGLTLRFVWKDSFRRKEGPEALRSSTDSNSNVNPGEPPASTSWSSPGKHASDSCSTKMTILSFQPEQASQPGFNIHFVKF